MTEHSRIQSRKRLLISSDSELVELMARGDSEALATLYERHAARLTVIARHILGRADEAEDLLHDVFLEVWRHAADYREERGTVWSWLSVRTRSRAIDRKRALPRKVSVELNETQLADLDYTTDLASAADAMDRSRLSEGWKHMSDQEREVLWFGYFEGLSSTEIAEQLRIPVGTVKSRTRGALTKLRHWFASKGTAA